MGLSYAEPDVIALAFILRLFGVRVIMMTDSKFDDRPRHVAKEFMKSLLMLPYAGAIVAGARQDAFVRFLGFGQRRPVLLGYDVVDLARVRAQGGGNAAPEGLSYAERPFVFVGRFVAKKNVLFLIDAYTRYVALAGQSPRQLILVGGGEMEPEVNARIAAHRLGGLVTVAGFLQADGVSATLAGALALVLPSIEEQWGLVVNEAMAFNLPLIVSEAVGARDTLVRNLVNGYVVETNSVEGFARAMLALADDEVAWRRMVAASAERALLGDTSVFAGAVDTMLAQVQNGWQTTR
jgi:L-malate glycosyltransferase